MQKNLSILSNSTRTAFKTRIRVSITALSIIVETAITYYLTVIYGPELLEGITRVFLDTTCVEDIRKMYKSLIADSGNCVILLSE